MVAAKAEGFGDEVVGVVGDDFGDLRDGVVVFEFHFYGDANGEFAIEFGEDIGEFLVVEETAEFGGIAGCDVDEDDIIFIDL